MGEIVVPVADRGLFTFFARHSGESQNPGKPWTPAFILFILRVADPGLVTFLARPSKVTKVEGAARTRTLEEWSG